MTTQYVYLDEFYSVIVCGFVFSLAAWKQLGMLYNERRTLAITVSKFAIGHVRYISILTWLRGFRVKIVNFCLSIPKRDSDTKRTPLYFEVCP